MTTIHVPGACPHDCPDTCAWTVTVTDGVATGVHGVKDHPITSGHLCVKMQRYEERTYHPDRLLRPLVRTGPKGGGQFREASWDEALGAVRDGLTRAIDDHGPLSVLPYSYMGTMGELQGSSMDRRLFNALGTAHMDGTICLAAGAWAWGLTYPAGWPATDIETVAEADLVVAWGANMVSTHLHFWPYFLQARKRGATIVCIDPVRTKTARASDVHLAPRPGSDGALALGLLHVIFAKGWEDTDFLTERTTGADDLRARAAEWPVERAAAATGLPEAAITDLASRFARGEVLVHQARPRCSAPRRCRTGLPGDPLPARGHRSVAPSGGRRARAQRQHLPRAGQRHGEAGSAPARRAHPRRQPGPNRPGAGRHLRRAGPGGRAVHRQHQPRRRLP